MAHKEKSWIVIRSYSDLMEAEIDKGILQKANIPCYIEGSGMAQVNPLLNQALGIRLRVVKEKLEEAKTILDAGF